MFSRLAARIAHAVHARIERTSAGAVRRRGPAGHACGCRWRRRPEPFPIRCCCCARCCVPRSVRPFRRRRRAGGEHRGARSPGRPVSSKRARARPIRAAALHLGVRAGQRAGDAGCSAERRCCSCRVPSAPAACVPKTNSIRPRRSARSASPCGARGCTGKGATSFTTTRDVSSAIDTVSENAARLGLSHEEVLSLLAGEFGMPVTPLGRAAASRFDPVGRAAVRVGPGVVSSRSRHRRCSGMFGRARRPRALVADAARGLEFAGRCAAGPAVHRGAFPAGTRDSAAPARGVRRLRRSPSSAVARVRRPNWRPTATASLACLTCASTRRWTCSAASTSISASATCCPGCHRGRPGVYHFVSGVRALDADAARRMRHAGVQPVPVSTAEVASAMMQLQGSLHCCCGSLSTDG